MIFILVQTTHPPIAPIGLYKAHFWDGNRIYLTKLLIPLIHQLGEIIFRSRHTDHQSTDESWTYWSISREIVSDERYCPVLSAIFLFWQQHISQHLDHAQFSLCSSDVKIPIRKAIITLELFDHTDPTRISPLSYLESTMSGMFVCTYISTRSARSIWPPSSYVRFYSKRTTICGPMNSA